MLARHARGASDYRALLKSILFSIRSFLPKEKDSAGQGTEAARSVTLAVHRTAWGSNDEKKLAGGKKVGRVATSLCGIVVPLRHLILCSPASLMLSH